MYVCKTELERELEETKTELLKWVGRCIHVYVCMYVYGCTYMYVCKTELERELEETKSELC
jgi:hypothetical protein